MGLKLQLVILKTAFLQLHKRLWNRRCLCPFLHDDLIRTKLAAAFLMTWCQPFGSRSALFRSRIFLPHTHTHTFPFSSSFPFHFVSSASLLQNQHSPAGGQAVAFAPATPIMRIMAVAAHKAGTLGCDVARCPYGYLVQRSVALVLASVYPGPLSLPGSCCCHTEEAFGRAARFSQELKKKKGSWHVFSLLERKFLQ